MLTDAPNDTDGLWITVQIWKEKKFVIFFLLEFVKFTCSYESQTPLKRNRHTLSLQMQQTAPCVTWNKNLLSAFPEDEVNVCWLLWQLQEREGWVWLQTDVPSVLPVAAWTRDDKWNELYVYILAHPSIHLPLHISAYVFSRKDAVSAATDEERLIKIHDVIQQLPPPHYRSA